MSSLFGPLFYNQVFYEVEQQWNRQLNDHEKHLASLVHDIVRTQMEVEELKILEVQNETTKLRP